MTHFVTFACGMCGWYAWYSKFPPTNSWCVIFPCWLLTLSAIQTLNAPPSGLEAFKLRGVPSFVVTAPLVLLVFLFAPATVGPALGLWMPVCCILGTWSGLARAPSGRLRNVLLITTTIAVLSLVSFGARDYVVYNQMSPEEKIRFLPLEEAGLPQTSATRSSQHSHQFMRILITAGPTREYLDEVRFLSNASSGKMGYALAAAAVAAGHHVELVTGPVCLQPPAGCQVTAVESSKQMLEACVRLFPECDGVIAAAAVTDYTPKLKATGKIKKTGQGLTLELVETADVLAALGATKGGRWVVGFALEAQNPREGALRKLSTKHCDAIVLNRPSAIGSEDNRVELITADGQTAATWADSKLQIAKLLVDWIAAHLRV